MLTRLFLLLATLSAPAAAPTSTTPSAAQLDALTAQFAPTDIKVDLSRLPDSEKAALVPLLRAAHEIDGLFLSQVWAGNEAMLLDLIADHSPLGKARLHAFLLNKGPWDRRGGDVPFVPGVPPKPPEATFYPPNAKEQIAKLIQTAQGDQKRDVTSFYTVARRDPSGNLVFLPYDEIYGPQLARIGADLREAAQATQSASLRTFLTSRAAALLSNDYKQSEIDWMALDSAIDPTVGPYEVYEDGWFNLKASFEAFITVADAAETQKLASLSGELQGLEDHLPIDARYRNPKLGATAPIRVVDELFAAGDANHGVQTAAFDLPNDEELTREKGTKRVLLRNVQEVKFKKVLSPIAASVLTPAERKNAAFDAFFTHILMHELMHGLGPHEVMAAGAAGATNPPVKTGGRTGSVSGPKTDGGYGGVGEANPPVKTGGRTGSVSGPKTDGGYGGVGEANPPVKTVREALAASYGAIEEAKADISGLWALQQLVDKGALPKDLGRTMYATFLASAFRTLRFGLNEAHGKGQALQLNYLLDKGGFRSTKDCHFEVDASKIKDAVRDLTHELMTLQAEGDRGKAEAMLSTLGVIRPEEQCAIAKLSKVPVDIEPRFVTAEALLKSYPLTTH